MHVEIFTKCNTQNTFYMSKILDIDLMQYLLDKIYVQSS